ncbi:Protein of unknown function [Burkholderia sp. D7]|nr:Protein of unknown function [Burkholderia sp. D7]
MNRHFIEAPGFAAQRERFMEAALAAGADLTEFQHPMRGPRGEMLATDVALIGDPLAPKRFIVISGTHGIEGYYGSEAQIAFLHSLQKRALPADVCVIVVHLINPWGTAWLRRVNEDNVDLNRNYVAFDEPLPDNARYEAFHDIYLCRDLDGPARRRADERLATEIERSGLATVMSIVEAGQYAHADGIFFGGRQATWSNQTLRAIAKRFMEGAQTAMCFDLHTGAGAFGHAMLLAVAQESYPALVKSQSVFGPWLYTIITGPAATTDSGIAATATGYTSQALLDSLPGADLMQLVIECGTYDGTRGHSTLRDDHWLHLYGDPEDETGRRIKAALAEHFYPADRDWRELVQLRTRQIFERGLLALQTA